MNFKRTRCPCCKGKLDPGQRIHPECIDAYAAAQEEKAKRKADKQARMAAKVERAETKKRKDALKSRPEWLKTAQKAFNAWVRYRDRTETCICCGKPFEPQKFGGSMDAGHYLSRGSAEHLRFDERNVFGQRKNCNRPGGATRADFRAGVIKRIGLEQVEALESDNSVKKWTIEDLKEITRVYREKLKALKESV